MQKYMLTGEQWSVADYPGPLEDQWEKFHPVLFEAKDDESTREVVKKLLGERGKTRKAKLWRLVKLQSS